MPTRVGRHECLQTQVVPFHLSHALPWQPAGRFLFSDTRHGAKSFAKDLANSFARNLGRSSHRQHGTRIHDPLRIQRNFYGTHRGQLGRITVFLQITGLQPTNPMFRADRPAHLMHQIM